MEGKSGRDKEYVCASYKTESEKICERLENPDVKSIVDESIKSVNISKLNKNNKPTYSEMIVFIKPKTEATENLGNGNSSHQNCSQPNKPLNKWDGTKQ